jgi:hypothetical protein
MSDRTDIFIRYLSFYLVAAAFYCFYNSLFDSIFFQIDYGKSRSVLDNSLRYVGWFLVLCTPWFLPFLLVYNLFTNELLRNNYTVKGTATRYTAALFSGWFLGFAVGRSGVSYYHGEYRSLKSILVFISILITLELTRDLVVRIKYKTALSE